MGIVNNSAAKAQRIRPEYFQAGGATFALVAFSLFFGPTPTLFGASNSKPEVRLAFFPNLTHAPALVGVKRGVFAKSFGQYRFSTKVVNAGPEAMEALLAGAVDVAYVGPSPALNTYVKTGGKALTIISGVCEGGAALVCRKDLNLKTVGDLDGRRVAVPEFGGTQDVSLRHFMKQANLAPRESGGTVEVLPIKNPEILALFKQNQLDAAWVPEPWASRLVVQAGAKVVVDESTLWPSHQFSTTVLVASNKFIKAHPDAVQTLVDDNRQVIDWIGSNSYEAKGLANAEIGEITGKPLSKQVVDLAWPHLSFSSTQDRSSLEAFASAAYDAGYLKDRSLVNYKIWWPSTWLDKKELLSKAK